jgi:NTE family protein
LLLTLAFVIADIAHGAVTGDAGPALTPPARPRIGLVLGGGGAKGAAHVGVLRVLEDLHIPIDCIAGTSMGALVGATFASGKSPKEVEKEVLAINWSQTVDGAGLRDRSPPTCRPGRPIPFSRLLRPDGFGIQS